MNINFNPAFQNVTGLNVQRINQSVAGNKQGAEEQENNGMRFDTVLISPQGQSNNLIDMLMKQKTSIKERMESLKNSAMEDGLSMDSIRAQLEDYEKQLQDIDSQVADAMAKEMQKQTEKMQENRSKKPMTEEEAQRARMTNLMSLSNDVQQAETIQSVKTKVDGQSGVLESEIELDKSRGGSVAGKEQKLAELEAKSAALTGEIGARAAQVNEKIKGNNEMTVDKAEEAEGENKEGIKEQLYGTSDIQQETSVGADNNEAIHSAETSTVE